MGSFDNRLQKPGNFLTQRDLTGAAAADSTTYNDTNFPPANAVIATGCNTIWITWTGTGGSITDTVSIEPLIRDGINNIWVRLAVVSVRNQEIKEVRVCGASQVFLRIDAQATTATNIKIRAALAEVEVTG